MPSTASLAATRFGIGLSPSQPAPADAGALLDALAAPDTAAERFPLTSTAARMDILGRHLALSSGGGGMAMDGAMMDGGAETIRDINLRQRDEQLRDLTVWLARAAFGPSGLRERLVLFWAAHFATRATEHRMRGMPVDHAQHAIRPHITGDYAGLLRAAILHPAMLHYLDQHRSAGPNAPDRPRRMGLNENLGRELLELHTLSSDGGFTQADVHEMALALTGWTLDAGRFVTFDPGLAEPGPRKLLGRSYGGAAPDPELLLSILDDLARHPATARHVTRRLARHFLGPAPAPGLEDRLAAVWLDSGGALMPVYAALLEHPAAWRPDRPAVRRPFDFIAAALRALDPAPEAVTEMGRRDIVAYLDGPLRLMGQPFCEPPDPAGWSDDPAQWISPAGLAARLQWAMAVPRVLAGQHDPRAFVQVALGDLAGPEVLRAAHAAETRWEGVALVLAAPAFHRR